MKSQGLPMQTIVLIVIAVVALVVIIFYFYSGFTQGSTGTNTMLNISSNKSGESCCLSAQFGGCPSDKPYCCPSTDTCVSASGCSSCSTGMHACSTTHKCISDCGSCSGATTQCSDNVCRSSC